MMKPPADPTVPAPPANPPIFGQDQMGKKPKSKSMNPTFLGEQASANPTNTGQKTLLGA